MFNKDFQFGVATSSYQIEGTQVNDENINSIWDSFAKVPDAISDGSDGSTACEHVLRYKEDVSLMKNLDIDIYRFSISWARIMPEKGIVSKEGLLFYRNLLKELKNNSIKASVTIYHWDLPQWIYEENGGWTCRDTAYLFLEYSKLLFDEFDEFVDSWVTFNEPFCSVYLGYLTGSHAPGHKNAVEYLKAAHTINLAHGLAVQYYKSNYKKSIGIVLNLSPAYTVDNSFNNKIAKEMQDASINRMHLDPIFKGSYPIDYLMSFGSLVNDFNFIKEDDLSLMCIEIDFLGINYYTRSYVEYNSDSQSRIKHVDTDIKKTAMGWEVTPNGLYDVVHRVRKDYTDIPIIITENGSAWEDKLIDGRVYDKDRIGYLNSHLEVVDILNNENMNIVGYYAWSFMDNFEWSYGYEKRFGLVYVDYETQKRYPKDSYYRYKEIVKNRKL